jgi:hypothetical protein
MEYLPVRYMDRFGKLMKQVGWNNDNPVVIGVLAAFESNSRKVTIDVLSKMAIKMESRRRQPTLSDKESSLITHLMWKRRAHSCNSTIIAVPETNHAPLLK